MVPWDMLCADDLVISAETESQSIERFNAWNKDLLKRGWKIYVDKTKHLTSGQKSIPQKTGKNWWAFCLKGVGANLIRRNSRNQLVPKKCSSLRKAPNDHTNYICPSCNNPSNYHSNENATLPINQIETLRNVKEFCYIGDLISVESEAICASSIRLAAF